MGFDAKMVYGNFSSSTREGLKKENFEECHFCPHCFDKYHLKKKLPSMPPFKSKLIELSFFLTNEDKEEKGRQRNNLVTKKMIWHAIVA